MTESTKKQTWTVNKVNNNFISPIKCIYNTMNDITIKFQTENIFMKKNDYSKRSKRCIPLPAILTRISMVQDLMLEDVDPCINFKKANAMGQGMQVLHQRGKILKDEVTTIIKDQIRIVKAVLNDVVEVH